MQVRDGYKQSEVRKTSDGWSEISMAKHASLKARIGWQALTTEEYLHVGTHYLVTGTDFVNGRIYWSTCHFVDEWRYSQDRNIQLQNGDVLLTKDGTIGKVGYVENMQGPATLNSGVFVIRPIRQAFHPLFLFYVLASKAFDEFLSKITAGSTITHLYQKDFITFEFSAPDLKEQIAIATALQDIDALLEAQNKLIAKNRDIKQACMQQLLTGKQRLPGFTGEWEVKRLGDVATVLKGSGLSKDKVSRSGSQKCLLYGELFTTYSRVIADVLSSTDSCEGTLSIYGDVLLPGSTTTTGIDLATASALLCNDVLLGGDINIVRAKGSFYSSTFLAYLLTEEKKHKIAEMAQGITIIHLYGKSLLKLELCLPAIEEQTEIANILTDMDADLAALEQQRDKTRAIKQGMIQELLTGRIRLV